MKTHHKNPFTGHPFFRRKGWKFIQEDPVGGIVRSNHGWVIWKPGEWQSVEGSVLTCVNGFHMSPRIGLARNYVSGNVIALVEGGGSRRTADEGEKTAFKHMRVLRAWKIPPGGHRNAWDHNLSPNSSTAKIDEFFSGWTELWVPAPEPEQPEPAAT